MFELDGHVKMQEMKSVANPRSTKQQIIFARLGFLDSLTQKNTLMFHS